MHKKKIISGKEKEENWVLKQQLVDAQVDQNLADGQINQNWKKQKCLRTLHPKKVESEQGSF